MYGTLRGALAGRKIAFDRESYKATVEGRIVGVGKTDPHPVDPRPL
jgi:hypothetical protein